MDDEPLLTLQEVSDILRVPVATLRYWRHVGTGPKSFRIGQHVRFRRADVNAWVEQQYQLDAPGSR